MNWNGYTVFSVLSGAILVVAALVSPGLSANDRFYGLLGGAVFIGYGTFAASQTSGTFLFPIWIFIIPPAAIVYLVVAASGKTRRSTPTPAGNALRAGAAQGEGDLGAHPSQSTTAPGSSSPPVPPASAKRPDVWSPPPPPPGSPATGA